MDVLHNGGVGARGDDFMRDIDGGDGGGYARGKACFAYGTKGSLKGCADLGRWKAQRPRGLTQDFLRKWKRIIKNTKKTATMVHILDEVLSLTMSLSAARVFETRLLELSKRLSCNRSRRNEKVSVCCYSSHSVL